MSVKAAVLGAGSWGTALAVHLGRRGPVSLWARAEDDPARIAEQRENRSYLPGVALTPGVSVAAEVGQAVDGAGLIVLAVPTQFVRGFLERHRGAGSWTVPLAIAAKGIEVGTLALPSEIVGQVLGTEAEARAVAFSGPSFAREVVDGEPTAVVAACPDAAQAEAVQRLFSHDNLRVYTSFDALGVQLAGALKNVVAIAAGVLDGLNHGSNALAALITRGNAEISRLGVALGARRETFMGLAGMGDLVLTCTGHLSRNRLLGRELARGRSLAEIVGGMNMVAEGVETTRAAAGLAQRTGVEMPIVDQVHAILFEGRDPRRALAALLARPLKAETEDARS
ncbi:MAG: NAD(P)-dependent glycerol-3-phosphate dehydrogenase [Acidobacteria bacterium]|jgi:glycerol-3-phosphate dehydrogenase (NAD(P)+)|nr:NAD(P)-dependent glycerol-3-phosphate dehydrogenase [Acidobacteriota bacterium]MCU0253254.1 NAD(P)-dependent glycerol-3-phosphate dehydrogenase [Acidobacteriota bacterium]